ncbi:actin, cytoskeletal 4-like [Pollicipes pollicipes]|uniref:actin, cytoskeletal 4-like n=1 Tax=Pollicipes pollicipes TaxID=41117 RepID=UPI00188546C8|nr:actin, cytoskeletal 4-like [Pollicipes pollicipes]
MLSFPPTDYGVQLSLPAALDAAARGQILGLLFDEFGARAVSVQEQSVLALAAYNATSGVVVDIGDRMDVVPIVNGAVRRVPLVSEVETLLLRHLLQRLCFVSERYEEDLRRWRADPASLERAVPVHELLGDSAPWRQIGLDCGRFQVPEGLFNPEIWGLDHKGLHKLVQKAVQACSVDSRRQLMRSVYLAGGATLLPAWPERLQAELDALSPPSVTPRVHASPYRQHAAYLGACVLAGGQVRG